MRLLAWDLETHLIQPGLLAPPIVCGAFAWSMSDGTIDYILHDRIGQLSVIESALRGTDTIVGANIAYDFGCLLAEKPELLPLVWQAYVEARVFDVLIAGTLDAIYGGRLTDGELFYRNGKKNTKGRYSLETVTIDYLNRADAKKSDDWRLSYALLDGIPVEEWPEEAAQYPIDDVINTLQVAQEQMKVCRNLHNLPAQARAAFCAHLGAIHGIRLDVAEVDRLKKRVDTALEEHARFCAVNKFTRTGGTKKAPKQVKDTKYIKELVFKAYDGLPPTTPKGEVSTEREKLEDSGDPLLEKLAEGSKWEKLRTYADELSSLGNKPMNVSCNILLSTGRASYSGLIQLMPRKGGVRECIIPQKGHVLCSVDYAAVEMSTLGQVQLWTLGRSKLAEAINNDIDPHSLFAAGMTNREYANFVLHKEEPEEKGQRTAAKAGNFGFPGMMGPAKFVIAKRREGYQVCEWFYRDGFCGSHKVRTWSGRQLDAPLCGRCCEAASKLRLDYLRQWPEMKPYWDWVSAHTEGGRLEQFVSQRVRGGLSAPAAANTLFQGLAADGAKLAVVKLTEEMYLKKSSALYGARLLVFAHDETILSIPEEQAHEGGHLQAKVMIEAMREFVPDVKISAEPALMRRWSKDVKTVYKNDRLVCWDD